MNGVVAIIGRPNVGKSTLFNRLVEERKAIIDDQPGVTRDRNYGISHWNGKSFSVIDTGGYIPLSTNEIDKAIREQVNIAIEESDVVLFLVDVKDGLTYEDEAIANIVRQKSAKNVILVVNKVDHFGKEAFAGEFYSLALDPVFTISSITGSGTGELLDKIVEILPDESVKVIDETIPKIAIVGRPNVGKSSLINALTGKNVNIVTPIAGTTRDSIYTKYQYFGFNYILIDTAGLRKKSKVSENVEFYSTIRTLKAIQEADVCLLMIDALRGLESQDLSILSHIEKLKKGLIILVNKWDAVEKTKAIDIQYRKLIEERIAPLSNIPILLISATEKTRIFKVMEEVGKVYNELKKRIPTHTLNEILLPIIEQSPPSSVRGKLIRIKYITQVNNASSPTFLFFCNHPQLVKENYRRFLENQIRKNYGFEGCPVNIFFREK